MNVSESIRNRLSALTSAVLVFVITSLPYIPPQYRLVYYFAIGIFTVDSIVKALDVKSLRSISSALYSFALAVSFMTFFQVLGTPLSQIFGILLILDAYLKLTPGTQYIFGMPETRFRHLFSAIMTILVGASILFGVFPRGSPLLGFIAGSLILIDGIIKAEYVKLL